MIVIRVAVLAIVLLAQALPAWAADIEVLSWSWSRKATGYLEARGEIRNISGGLIDDLVIAEVRWYDSSGTYVTHGIGNTRIKPFAQGATATFHALAEPAPEAEKAAVFFSTFRGEPLTARRR